MVWKVEIEKGLNGYVVNSYEDDTKDTIVFEIDSNIDEVKAEQLAFRNMAYYLRDYFAVYNDKHSNEGKGQYLTIEVTNDN
jgi:formylmethanofuran dehydrogenase subunit C